MNKILMSLAVFVVALPSLADDIRLGNPAYNGTGCPAGTATAALSPDSKSLSILFSDFSVEAGGVTGRYLQRKNCDIAIPVHVPNGMSVSVINIDYRGFTSLPVGTMAMFNAEYFFAGSRGPSYSKVFSGPNTNAYMLRNTLTGAAISWSPCGQDVNLRATAGMFVRSSGASALSTVDSADINAGLVYSLQWKKC